MGKAFVSIADDASAIFMNSAGLAKKPAFKIVSMSGNLMMEVPYAVAGIAVPMLGGVAGLGYAGLNISGIKEATLVGGVPQITGNEGSFNNYAINLSYARSISPGFGIFKDIKAGATVKRVSMGFSGIASAEAGTGSGYDMDLGAAARIGGDADIGLVLKNIIPGNNLKEDEIPMSVTAGISKTFSRLNLLTAVDIEYAKTLLVHAGLEFNPVAPLKIRLGLDQKPDSASTITNWSAGVGFNFRGVTFDYAYHTYANVQDFATHYFSIGFNGTPPISEAAKLATSHVPQDIARGTWQEKAASFMVEKGYFKVDKDKFRPDTVMARADVASVIAKAVSAEGVRVAVKNFWYEDVLPGYWARDAIDLVSTLKIMSGTEGGRFRPSKAVSLSEAVIIMCRYKNLKIEPVLEPPYANISVTHWAAPYIQAAKNAGMLDFIKNGYYDGKEPLTKIQLSWMMYKAAGK